MKVTFSVIKADVGSIGGHTRPSEAMVAAVAERLHAACAGPDRLLIDAFVTHTGDDIALIMSHTHGVGARSVHELAWDCFLAAAGIAKTEGLYGAGQDLLIAGKYTGKDDPVAVVRTQGIFPAPEEAVEPYLLGHFVAGDCRGSHVMPIMPVAAATAVTGPYCLPIVTCLAFSMDDGGAFARQYVDMFAGPAWDRTRLKVQEKADEWRRQGFVGPTMAAQAELAYTGIVDTLEALDKEFSLR